MNMLTALQRSGGIDALARQAGVEPPQAHAAVRAMLPAMLALFRDVPGGRQGLLAEFEKQGGTALAAAVMAVDRADPAPGQAILDGPLGEQGAELAGIAAKSGPSAVKLLPLLVMLSAGYVCAMAAGHGAGPEGLDSLLG